MKTKWKSIIHKFSKARVLVIGGLILDEFIWGKVDRISPEAPVPVVLVNSESFMPGVLLMWPIISLLWEIPESAG